jgi:hypothetical protein
MPLCPLATRLGAILLLAALSSTERAGTFENAGTHLRSSSRSPGFRHNQALHLKSKYLLDLRLSLRGGGRIWEDLYEPDKEDNAPGKFTLTLICFVMPENILPAVVLSESKGTETDDQRTEREDKEAQAEFLETLAFNMSLPTFKHLMPKRASEAVKRHMQSGDMKAADMLMKRYTNSRLANWKLLDPYFNREKPRANPSNLSEVFDRLIDIQRAWKEPLDVENEKDEQEELNERGSIIGLDGEALDEEEDSEIHELRQAKVLRTAKAYMLLCASSRLCAYHLGCQLAMPWFVIRRTCVIHLAG